MRLLAFRVQDCLGGSTAIAFNDRVTLNGTMPKSGGALAAGDRLLCYATNRSGETVAVEFARSALDFSSNEIRFLSHLFHSLTVLIRGFDEPRYAVHHRVAILSTIFDIAVARFLRCDSRRFTNVQRLIGLLKDLTYQRYEGTPCTSGLVYVNKPRKGYIDRLCELGFRIARTPVVRVTQEFFRGPLAYRYVDGTQSAFLLQSPGSCVGILQLAPNLMISSIDLACRSHFVPAFEVTGSESFAAFVTENSEVDVLFGMDGILRWRQGHWILLELGRMVNLLAEHLDSPETARLLTKIALATSTSRHGALILISDCTPGDLGIVRRIDDTEIGKILRERLLNLPVGEAYTTGVFTAAITSDGMTVIDRTGVVRDSGALINLAGSTTPGGGGRTAAAQSASRHGLVIKISADGPIQLWRNGSQLLQAG